MLKIIHCTRVNFNNNGVTCTGGVALVSMTLLVIVLFAVVVVRRIEIAAKAFMVVTVSSSVVVS